MMKRMEPRMTILGLGVRDFDKSKAFYENVFGWEATAASNENIRFYQLNGVLLSIYPIDKLAEDAEVKSDGSGFKGFSIAYNTRSESETDEVFKFMESHGVKIIKPPHKVFWGGYSGYIADPDGHLWEIAYNPFLEMDEKGNTL